MKAKKSYGQHFLREIPIARRIAESLSLFEQYRVILEVGPGQGILTTQLLDTYPNHEFFAVDADVDMVNYIKENFPKMRGKVWLQDFLKLNIGERFKERQVAIIGNFPYNISSQILFKAVENRHLVPELVGMFQKEVAERIVSAPGSKVYGVLSILIQAYYDAEYLFTVGPGSFSPPPKVQSAVVRLHRKADTELGCNASLFRRVVKETFGQRRKMLRNTLKHFLPQEVLDANDVLFQMRPESLSVQQFIDLTNLVEKHSNAADKLGEGADEIEEEE